MVSKLCGPAGYEVQVKFTAYTSPAGKEPCTNNAPPQEGIPWALPYSCGPVPTHTGTGFANVISRGTFDTILPPVNDSVPRRWEYTYDNFVAAAALVAMRVPNGNELCNTGDAQKDSRECAALLANMAHETLHGEAITEEGNGGNSPYCSTDPLLVTDPGCACAPGKLYSGRGPLQLSWNFNYCSMGKLLYPANPYFLINFPDTLGDRDITNGDETDPVASIAASMAYWMTQEGPNDGTVWDGITPHLCMVNDYGFGCTIRAINGLKECPALGASNQKGVTNARNKRRLYNESAVSQLGTVNVGDDDCINAP